MKHTVRLGRLAGIPVAAHWSVLVILLLIMDVLATAVIPDSVKGTSSAAAWSVAFVAAALFVAALFAHEFAHAVLARRYGIRVEGITLWMLGGFTQLADEPDTARADLVVAVVGPATSILAGLVFGAAGGLAALSGAPDVIVAGLAWLAGINVLLAVFNLLPGAPLDGGRVLRALVWLRTGDRRRAAIAATQAGRFLGSAMIGLGVLIALGTTQLVSGLWLALLGWFLLSSATAEASSGAAVSLLGDTTVGDIVARDTPLVPAYVSVTRAAELVEFAHGDTFPVVTFEGAPAGLLTVDDMIRVPADDRDTTLVGTVALPAGRVAVVAPEDALAEVLRRGRILPAVVAAEGRVVGLLTQDDVRSALRRAALHPAEGPSDPFRRADHSPLP